MSCVSSITFFFSSRRRHTRYWRDWSSDVCSSDLAASLIVSGRGLRRVVNATGVVLHTNLGRSVLSERAVAAVAEAARNYSNLESDLSSGARGSRYDHAVPLLRELTGAADALVVNN